MKITMTAVGSRGDIQPYIALGKGLQKAGHQVCLSAPGVFQSLIHEHGIDLLPISVNPQEIMQHPEVQAASKSGNYFRLIRTMFREGTALVKTFLDEVYANCQHADVVVSSMIPYGAFDAAEKNSIPFVQTVLAPYYPTTDFAAPGFTLPIHWGAANRLTHGIVDQSFWQFFRSTQNRWRKNALGLSPLPFSGPFKMIRRSAPTLMGYSPAVVPTPPDWPESVSVCGYWFLDEPDTWQPPADLLSFLASESPPVYIGFGSMPEQDASQMTQTIIEALRRSGQRCILLSGWAGLGRDQLPDNIYCAESIPHAWLFPRMTAVVHHGGAGTTAAGLRAGVPSIITPYTADQFFWADRVSALGAGPRSVPYHQLTPTVLAEIISQAVTQPEIRQRAAELGKQIRAEDGVTRAVERIERMNHH